MKKRSTILFVVSFFAILVVVGVAYVAKGQFPYNDQLMQAATTIKNLFYLPSKEDHTVISGIFDMAPQQNQPAAASGVSREENQGLAASPAAPPEKKVDLDLTHDAGYLIMGDTLMQMCNTNEEVLTIYADTLNRLQAQLPDKRVISMVAPNSFPFYAPPQYMTAAVDQKAMIQTLYAKMDARILKVDVYSELEKDRSGYNFFRTDHHWTARGAYHAYTALCKTLGMTPSPLPSEPSGVIPDFVGATYNMVKQYPQSQAAFKNPDYIEYYLPKIAYTATYYQDALMQNGQPTQVVNPNIGDGEDKYIVFLEGYRPIIHIKTDTKNGRSLMLIKDSYASPMITYLLEHYENLYVVDFRTFNAPDLPPFNAVEFAKSNNIDDVMVENYPYVPNDKAYSEMIARMVP